MSETRPPPPTLPLRLVQPPNAALSALRTENARLSAELASKDQLVEILRQALKELQDAPSAEATEPGIAPPAPKAPLVPPPLPTQPRGGLRRSEWLMLGSLVLGTAGVLAAQRYPVLMAPLRYLQEHLPELLDTVLQ